MGNEMFLDIEQAFWILAFVNIYRLYDKVDQLGNNMVKSIVTGTYKCNVITNIPKQSLTLFKVNFKFQRRYLFDFVTQ